MTILDALRRDHELLLGEMDELAAGSAGPGRLRRFVGQLLEHAHLEDELLFAALEEHLPPGDGPIAVMREEHEAIESLLAGLAERDAAGEEPGDALRRLLPLAHDHFAKEEQVLFGFAERLIDGERLVELGETFGARRG